MVLHADNALACAAIIATKVLRTHYNDAVSEAPYSVCAKSRSSMRQLAAKRIGMAIPGWPFAFNSAKTASCNAMRILNPLMRLLKQHVLRVATQQSTTNSRELPSKYAAVNDLQQLMCRCASHLLAQAVSSVHCMDARKPGRAQPPAACCCGCEKHVACRSTPGSACATD